MNLCVAKDMSSAANFVLIVDNANNFTLLFFSHDLQCVAF